jgi:hypothetical protein
VGKENEHIEAQIDLAVFKEKLEGFGREYSTRFKSIDDGIKDINTRFKTMKAYQDETFVTQAEFKAEIGPLKKIGYGVIGFITTIVLGVLTTIIGYFLTR